MSPPFIHNFNVNKDQSLCYVLNMSLAKPISKAHHQSHLDMLITVLIVLRLHQRLHTGFFIPFERNYIVTIQRDSLICRMSVNLT